MTAPGESQPVRVDRHRRAFLNAALPGIWLDARGRIVEVNDAAAELRDVDGRPVEQRVVVRATPELTGGLGRAALLESRVRGLGGLDARRLALPEHKRLEIDYGHPIREIIA